MWGYSTLWLVLSIATIAARIPFNIGWWGFTFPIGDFDYSTRNQSAFALFQDPRDCPQCGRDTALNAGILRYNLCSCKRSYDYCPVSESVVRKNDHAKKSQARREWKRRVAASSLLLLCPLARPESAEVNLDNCRPCCSVWIASVVCSIWQHQETYKVNKNYGQMTSNSENNNDLLSGAQLSRDVKTVHNMEMNDHP